MNSRQYAVDRGPSDEVPVHTASTVCKVKIGHDEGTTIASCLRTSDGASNFTEYSLCNIT